METDEKSFTPRSQGFIYEHQIIYGASVSTVPSNDHFKIYLNYISWDDRTTAKVSSGSYDAHQ
jgi:hypothetical protein